MQNLKIGTRLALGFGLVLALLLVISGISSWRMLNTAQNFSFLATRQDANDLMLQWSRQVEVNTNQSLAVANLTNPIVLEVFKKGMDLSDQKSLELQKKVGAAIRQPEAIELFKQASKTGKTFADGRRAALKSLGDGDYAAADQFFTLEMPKLSAQYIHDIDALSHFQKEYVGRLFAQEAHESQLGLIVLGIATLLALILGPLFAWRTTRGITRPISAVLVMAQAISKRDLSRDIHAKYRDEIGQLMRALGIMTSNLRGAVGEVRTGADSIASAAAQITAGNLDLSSRTEQQASSLAQTAATMEQITATVRQNADSVQQANTLATAAAKTATDGGTIVAQLVTTMGEINQKSKQVADIIGVIDSIAFQTNILALNAAVEAARAGEQGRGFAVVASEVRALAQRSASAAKEIKTLIDASVQSTHQGNEQASHAGATMQDIVDGINRVTDIMGEISAANREQTTGIEEINTAVTQMDDVTRQNASLVEESAAAASSLQDQANTLAQLVETFHLDSTPGQRGSRDPAQATPSLPAAPEKVISPPPARAHRAEPLVKAQKPQPATKPALRAPNRPVTDDNEEWTEF